MRLGELLLDHDLITEEQLERALAEQRRRGGRLGETLVRQEAISEEMLQYHLGYQVTRRKDEERSFGRLRLIRTLLARFWQLSPRAVPASVLLILLGTAMTLTFPWFVKLVVDSEIDAGDARAVLVLAAAMVALQVMAQVALYQANQIFNLANMRLSNHLREGLLEVLFLAHGSTVAARGTGEWLTNLTTDVDNVVERWEHLFITFFKNLFAIIGSCLILILVDPWLTAAVLVLSVLTVWLPGRISNLANPPLMRRPHLIADLVGQLRQALGAGRAIRGFNAQPAVLSDLDRRLTAYYRNDFLMVRPWNVAFNLRLVLGALLLGLVLFIGGRQVIAGRYSLGDLMMVIVTVSMLAPFVDELMQIIIKTNDVKRYWQRCCDVLELNVRRDHPLRRSRQQIQTDGSVTIEGLSFSFGRQRVLERIDLSFEPCRGYAVIGRSGSGKTTLLRLLLRELEPDEGRLLIGSTPISAMSEATLLGLVSHVAQRPVVFAASAYDNIAMGGLEFHERLEPEQVYAAARSAGVHERILTLPEGYDTMLGDGGHPLSGGERQRLAIARALLKSPAVCLLDEPTGSLDRDNEQLVLETILGLAGRCTVIMSTHNPTLIRAMDEVVILEQGSARVVPPGALDADRILALLEGAGAGQDEAEPR